jgi:cytochrome P450
VLGHPEASTVLNDPAAFSSDLNALQPVQDDLALFQRGNFVSIPPQHRKLRTLVSQTFTPRVVADLEPRIAELTTQLLDEAGERFDLIDALAYPLPVIVIAELLGIPTSDRGLFRTWADVLLGQETDPEQDLREASEQALTAVAPTMREMNAYFLEHIRSRRASPGHDLTSRLVQAEVDGERLADEEIIGFVGPLPIAGHITTTATLGNSVLSFQEHQDAVAEVRADPSLLPAGIEEVLRVRTPFPRLGRVARADAEVGGVRIRAGQLLMPWLAAANRDAGVHRAGPVRHPSQAQPAPDVRARHPHLPRRAACPAGGQSRAAPGAGALPGRGRGRGRVDDEVRHRSPWTMVAVRAGRAA